MTATMSLPGVTRPATSTLAQWWVLTVRTVTPTVRNGELLTQIVGSIVFTIGYYLPLKNLMGMAQHMSNYAQYLTPLIVLQAVWFAGVSAAFRSATDRVKGVNRRLTAMPIAALTPLASRMSASMYRCAVALAVSVACGYVIGFRFHSGLTGAVGFCALVMFIGLAVSVIGDLIGLITKNPESTAPIMLLPQVTLGLASVGLQPVERFPDWIQGFVRDQPISQFIYAMQALAGDSTPAAPELSWATVGPALAWAAGMTVLAVWLHTRASARRR